MAKAPKPKSEMTFPSTVDRLDGNVYLYVLAVPAKVVEAFGGGYKRRYVCTASPGKKGEAVSFSCSIMPRGGGRGFVMLSKPRMKKLDLREGNRTRVRLVVDSSRHGMPVPAEWKELLKGDALGKKRFEALTPGKRRYVLHHVGGVKNPALRLERAMRVLENLKRLPPGGGSYREMFGIAKTAGPEGPAMPVSRPKSFKVVEFSELTGAGPRKLGKP